MPINPPTQTRSFRLYDDGRKVAITKDGKVTHYEIEKLDPHPIVGTLAYRMTKLTEGGLRSDWFYDVIQTVWGGSCDCGDATFNHKEDGLPCKHLAFLQATGKLPKGTPA